jgi:uncharacterized protein YndB with AHSA1/START domain
MLKKILAGFVALVTAFAFVVAMQPSEYRLARATTIAAPPADVFKHVNDLRAWDNWSPWAKLDPNAKVTFEGPAAGAGAVFKWSGNDKVGEGTMTITESRPNELVRLKTDFVKPFEGTSNSEFAFTPAGNQTQVTWTMYGTNNFIAKAICLFVSMEKMMGPEFEKGLAQMKRVVEGK